MLFDSCHLSQLPCLFPQSIPPPAHNSDFSQVGNAANHIRYLFEAKITAVECELVPIPEAIFLLWRRHKTTELEGTS